ncbi:MULTISPECIES: DUF1775 domain-containing protein [unclassified Sinorhizobium]|uniref:DUF1775 domain-containing protein n=1 Tax=unclassified Sinorhizobium TaxID=2613772 RepID=UPI0035260E2D
MKAVKTFGLAAILSPIIMSAAHAHVTFLDGDAPQDSTFIATLQVPHGCDGKATTEIRVKLPEGFAFAKPQPKPGWELEVIKGDYQKSYDNHGEQVKSGPLEVRWKNGDLSDDFYDTFVLRGSISGIAAGASLAFPVTQVCGDVSEVWDQVAAEGVNPHSLKSPAPVLRIIAAEGHGHHDMAGMDMSGMKMGGMTAAAATPESVAGAKIGEIEISAGFTKAMLPGQPVGGGFLTIHNSGKSDDRLVSVTSSTAGHVALHEMQMQGTVMRMRELKDGISVPAGATVELVPGGLHMMFEQVKEPFREGGRVPVTLTFEKAGKIDIELPTVSARGK